MVDVNKFKIEKLLQDFQGKHSDFQIDNFIIRVQGDNWAQYKQALLEIRSRYRNLTDLNEEKELLEMKLEKAVSKRFVFGKLNKRILKTEIARKRRQLKATREEIEDISRELTRLVELATELKAEIGEFDEQRRKQLEADSWVDKASRMLTVDLMANGAVNQATLEMILALPKEKGLELLTAIENRSIQFRIGNNDR